jgi:teichuronic acid biosynthesis glycosyltransferase TuaH
LATGKPVVISPLPEYEPLRDVLRIARSREDFLALVDEALLDKDPEASRRRQASVKDGTWDARAQWVSDIVEKKLAEKEKTAISA